MRERFQPLSGIQIKVSPYSTVWLPMRSLLLVAFATLDLCLILFHVSQNPWLVSLAVSVIGFAIYAWTSHRPTGRSYQPEPFRDDDEGNASLGAYRIPPTPVLSGGNRKSPER